MVNVKFIIFLKTTLGKMVSSQTLDPTIISLNFWKAWPRKFYNVKVHDLSKEDKAGGLQHPPGDHDYDDLSPTQNELSQSILATQAI